MNIFVTTTLLISIFPIGIYKENIVKWKFGQPIIFYSFSLLIWYPICLGLCHKGSRKKVPFLVVRPLRVGGGVKARTTKEKGSSYKNILFWEKKTPKKYKKKSYGH